MLMSPYLLMRVPPVPHLRDLVSRIILFASCLLDRFRSKESSEFWHSFSVLPTARLHVLLALICFCTTCISIYHRCHFSSSTERSWRNGMHARVGILALWISSPNLLLRQAGNQISLADSQCMVGAPIKPRW